MKLKVNAGKGLALAAVLLFVTLGVLIPGQSDLDKLQALMDRGNYSAVIKGAERLLARKPEANEFRDCLAQAQLAVGDWAGALVNTGVLHAAGWDTEPLESQFPVAIIVADAARAGGVLAAAEEVLSRRGKWPWLEQFALNLLLQSGAVERAPGVLSHLSKARIEAALDQIWEQLVMATDNLDAAWRTASLLDERGIAVYGSNGSRQLLFFLYQCPPEAWLQLQERYPDDSILAAIRSQVMPQGGLDWLAAWEENRRLEPTGAYCTLKGKAVAQAQQVEARHLKYLPPLEILRAALMDAVNKEKLDFILGYLADLPEPVADMEVLSLALTAPEPVGVFPRGPSGESYTLSGDWLCISKRSDSQENVCAYYNLVNGEEYEYPGYFGCWSPDGSYLAQLGQGKLRIYDAHGKVVHELSDTSFAIDIGWRDEKTLWVPLLNFTAQGGITLLMHTLTVEDGVLSQTGLSEFSYHRVQYGPGGRLAWQEGNRFFVYDGEVTHSLEANGRYSIWGWAPDGSAVIFGQQRYLLEDGTIVGKSLYYEIGGEVTELDLSPAWEGVVSWLSAEEITWPFPLVTGQSMLGIYNLQAQAVTMTGIVMPGVVSWPWVLVTGADEVYVYALE